MASTVVGVTGTDVGIGDSENAVFASMIPNALPPTFVVPNLVDPSVTNVVKTIFPTKFTAPIIAPGTSHEQVVRVAGVVISTLRTATMITFCPHQHHQQRSMVAMLRVRTNMDASAVPGRSASDFYVRSAPNR